MKRAHIYTDGSCHPNPGPGGWAALVRVEGEKERAIYGGEPDTTNNRMEMTAVIEGLLALPDGCHVTVTLDSQYVKQGITEWIKGWKRRKWKTSTGEAVKNKDLWQELDREVGWHTVEWVWVKGHNGHPENERVDKLALKGRLEFGNE